MRHTAFRHIRKASGRRTTLLALSLATAALALTAAPALAVGPPLVTPPSFADVTDTSATLEAEINPNGREVDDYHFQYITQAAWEADGESFGAGTQSTPAAKIPNGNTAVPVSVALSGLSPGTTYHFRAVAHNVLGTGEGNAAAFATYASLPVFGPCPNDAFRTGHPSAALPDCRAYEQATPIDKNGGDATGIFSFIKAAQSGGAVTFLSTSGVPSGGESGAQELPLYLATRGEGTWSSWGLLPPADFGQRARVLGWTPDFNAIYEVATKFGNPRTQTLLVRSGPGGAVSQIAPYAVKPGYAFAGALADGSQVLFESTAKLPGVPGALEGASNVYAWDRASEELRLASVMNDGAAPDEGAFAGPYDWLRGTSAKTLSEGGVGRDYYTIDEHVLTAKGAYFTAAGTGQLYLRVNPTQPQSALDPEGNCTEEVKACTIHVSATQKTNGSGAGGSDAAGTRPAAFMGASTDGSVAFLTSSEKLTDDATTGIEPDPPALARADIGGTGTDLGFLPAKAAGVAVDGTYVYWADPEGGTIGRAKLDGSEPKPSFIEAAGTPNDVEVDAAHVYWTNTGDGANGNGTIGRANLDGSGANLSFITGASDPQGIAVNATDIFWGNLGNANDTEGIGCAEIDGGEPSQSCAVDGEGNPFDWRAIGLEVDGTYLYFSTSGNQGFIRRIPLAAFKTFPQIIVEGLGGFRGLAVDGSHLYWTNAAPAVKSIGRANLDGSGQQEEFIKATNPSTSLGLAVDAGHIYWSANQGLQPNPGNDLYRYEAASGALEDIAVDGTDTNGADVKGLLGTSADGSYAYFAANGVPDGTTGSPNARGETATPGNCAGALSAMSGTCNLYLWHEGEGVRFIARLNVAGDSFHTDSANWAAGSLQVFVNDRNFRKTASVSADGQTLLFRSQRQLDDYENAGTSELYRYRIGETAPRCLSCNPTGAPPTRAPSLGTINTSSSVPANPASIASRNMASEGQRIFFETTDALVAADTDGLDGCPKVGSLLQQFPSCLDVYEWEAKGSGSCESEAQNGGCIYLLSSGKDDYPSFFADASADGKDAFLFTREGFVEQDKDELLDVYAARVGGGIGVQNQSPSPPCEGEGCKLSLRPQAETTSPGSASFQGPADPKPRCPKSKRQVRRAGKARCVPKAKRHKRAKRRGHTERRNRR